MILGIDTSLGTAVAVVEADGVVRTQLESTDPRGHAELIGTLITEALADAGVGTGAIRYVAAGMGPGPYTGLRVGIAAARAFALGRGIPFVPVISHDAVALELVLHDVLTGGNENIDHDAFAVVTDARRRELAYTVYRGMDDDGLPIRVAEPALAPRDELDAILAADRILRRNREHIPAAMLALAAARAIMAGRTIAPPDAVYLRAPDVTPSTGPKRVGV